MVDATFNVLGPVQVRQPGGQYVRLSGKQSAVLASLLFNVNMPVSRERLVAALWEDPPASAIANLQTYVAQLRKALPPDTRLLTMTAGYMFEAAIEELDLLDFDQTIRLARDEVERGDIRAAVWQFERALSLWRGKPAEGTQLAGAMLARVTELEERLITARLDWAEAKLALGLPTEVVDDLRLFVAEQPLRERAWQLLMLAHAHAGQRDRALEAFHDARSALTETLGVEPSEELQQLQADLLAGTMPASRPAPWRPPRQLPSDVKHFSGMQAELASLDRLIPLVDDEPQRTAMTCVISGTGGVGKTSLAVHWAHGVRHQFPDGQLYLDLQGFTPAATPIPPTEAVRILLGMLQPTQQRMPSTFDEQIAFYRSLIADRRVLVMLDNARGSDQVRPLLPHSSGSLTLITSRTVPTGLIATEGAHLLRLAPMSDAQAGALLRRRLGAARVSVEPEAVDDIVTMCAGLPLALGIVAARAVFDVSLPLAALVDDLRPESTRLDALQTEELSTDLREVFGSSYHVLPPQVAEAFARLGLMPGPDICLLAAASLLGHPVAHTAKILRALETAHLLHQHVAGRYRMHDLVRLYAVERAGLDLSADDRRAAVRRLVDFVLHTSHAADRLVSPHRRGAIELAPPVAGCVPHNLADAAAAQAWFRAEHPNLLAAQRLAIKHDLDDAAWQLAWTLDTFHLRYNHRQYSVTTWQLALTAAERLKALGVHALVHQMLGRACARAGSRGESLSHFARAVALYDQSGDIVGQAHLRYALAIACEDWNQRRQALFHLEHALRLYKNLGDVVGEANALNSMGWYHALLTDFAKARNYCERALHLLRSHCDRVGEAAALDSLGYIAHNTGRHAVALEYYHRALMLRRENGNVGQEADTLSHLGDTYHALAKDTEAAHAWNQALTIYQDHHHTARIEQMQTRLENLAAHA